METRKEITVGLIGRTRDINSFVSRLDPEDTNHRYYIMMKIDNYDFKITRYDSYTNLTNNCGKDNFNIYCGGLYDYEIKQCISECNKANTKFIEYDAEINTPEECILLGAIDIKQKVESAFQNWKIVQMFCNNNFLDFPVEVLAIIAHETMKVEFKDNRSALCFFKPNIGEKKIEIKKEFDRTIQSPNF